MKSSVLEISCCLLQKRDGYWVSIFSHFGVWRLLPLWTPLIARPFSMGLIRTNEIPTCNSRKRSRRQQPLWASITYQKSSFYTAPSLYLSVCFAVLCKTRNISGIFLTTWWQCRRPHWKLMAAIMLLSLLQQDSSFSLFLLHRIF